MSVEGIWPVAAQLGEGPFWSAHESAVWFVDIKGRRIHRCDENGAEQRSWDAPEEIGFVVPAVGDRMIAGMKSGLYGFDPASGAFSLLTQVDSHRPGNRLNDACVDSAGRLWFGSMDNAETAPTGSLYRFDRDGLRRCDEGYVITNGPAVCPKSHTLYHVDTLERVVYAFDLDERGGITNKRVFVRVEKPGAYPDGPVVDSEGCVWIALYGGWGVHRYSPEGELLQTIDVPVAACTKVAFGGNDLRTMFITTSWKNLNQAERTQQPLAGGLFRVRVDTPGLPQQQVALRL
jgi:sugar lactone lactonase YvrE